MERLDGLIEKFKGMSDSHPCISSLWVNYLEAKKNNLNMRLTQGEKIMDGLAETSDINASLLMCLLADARNI
jgi:hypothetical protein